MNGQMNNYQREPNSLRVDTITWKLGVEALRRKCESKSFNLGLGDGFLDMTSKAQTTKEKQLNWSSKLKTSVLQKTPSRE